MAPSAPPFVDADELARILPMEAAVDALDRAFGGELPQAPPRSHLDVGNGDLLLMPAWDDRNAGVKLVTAAPGNPDRGLPLIHGIYVLFDGSTLAPVALFDAGALTAVRTAAVSAVATRHLARKNSTNLVIFGAGVQASSHLDAMLAVLDIDRVTVVSRGRGRADGLVHRARGAGCDASIGGPETVSAADVVCTCTTSREPLFDGAKLRHGAHVNAVGSYKRDARELDEVSIERARVFVDTEMALKESGDLQFPLNEGILQAGQVTTLHDLVATGTGRASDDEITVFKSVGAAFEDLVVARVAAERLQKR
ncbi:MAG TPA: ornithine cyclodeaminase family protein [Actinomycetota bacterium]|nr:ornithine cyclodeaminase family protein [Actinomycetota bacterium]